MEAYEFERRLREAVRVTVELASREVGHQLRYPQKFVLRSPTRADAGLSIDEIVHALYLGPERCHMIVDVALVIGGVSEGSGWIRASGHTPGAYADVWDPAGIGPFHPIGGFGTDSEWATARAADSRPQR